MGGAEVTATVGATPAVSLLITSVPDPVRPLSVCDAVTVTAPSGRVPTSTAEVVQSPALHTADAGMEPISTATFEPGGEPVTEQVPETV